MEQNAVFDPALKQYSNAFRAGEPEFFVTATAERWRAARRAAMSHVLSVIAGTRWRANLVLRGSVTMAAWFGPAAREPGDLDFVVAPAGITSDSDGAAELLDGVKAALSGAPGAGLRPELITESAIWTYERADGRRLVVPFEAPGTPGGSVQIDIVFGEELPMAAEELVVPGVREAVYAAPAPLALAWKLLWLATDMYPQGKDLYDAALLAEHTTVDLALVRDLMRPELGAEADAFTAESVLAWNVDWDNFTADQPTVEGDLLAWIGRLALALDRSWGLSATTHAE